jgi:hypothetical protein
MTPQASQDDTTQTPLTCIMPIKSATDYQALAELLKVAKPKVDLALDAISTVHFARFVFLQENTQLAIITTYDGSFDKYIADFANYIGDVFDALFQHISDPPPVPVKKNTAEFIAWVAAHDVPHSGFYSAYPASTVVELVGAQGAAPANARSTQDTIGV